jgi:predicted permease
MEQVWSDLRYAVRRLGRSPVFTAVAMLSLALGTGANVAIFSLANAVMLKVLPVREPQRLVRVMPGDERRGGFLTNPIWEQIRDRDDLLGGAFAWSNRRLTLESGGEIEDVRGLLASGSFFDVLGTRAILGRTLRPQDDRRGGGADGPAAVISYRYWQVRHAGSPEVLGRSIRLEGHEFTIVGVTPPGFFGVDVGLAFDVAVPLAADALLSGNETSLDRRDVWWLRIMGRLEPGQAPAQALAALRASQPAIREATMPPDLSPDDQRAYLHQPFDLVEAPAGTSSLRLRHRTTLLVLMGIVGIVLLTACANLANLLLARASARRHELAVRLAVGATRGRLVRQLLAESLVLALAGSALGLVFARGASALVVHELSSRTNRVWLDLSLDWRVLAFTAALGLVTALLFGAAPALRSAQGGTGILAHGSAGVGAGGRRYPLEKLFAIVQVALCLVLLFGAGLFVRSFAALLTVDTGFDRRNVLVVSLDLRRTGAGPARRAVLFDEALASVRAVPGVESAALTLFAPISGAWSQGPVEVPGLDAAPPQERQAYFNAVSEDYFRALGVPFLAGRDFARGDTLGSPRVAIVNQAFVRRFFGGSNPVGRALAAEGIGTVPIVGFVADTKYRNLREPAPPTVFLPERQRGAPEPWLHLVIRGRTDLAALSRSVSPAIARVDDRIELDARPLDRDVDDSLIQERLVAALSGFFGALALLVASLGLFGLVSLAVTRRQREIGVRLALGALPRTVLRMVLRDVWVVTGIGVLAGSLGSLGAARVASSLVFGIEPTDAATLALAVSILGATATLAGYLPARRAARLDPTALLREP